MEWDASMLGLKRSSSSKSHLNEFYLNLIHKLVKIKMESKISKIHDYERQSFVYEPEE